MSDPTKMLSATLNESSYDIQIPISYQYFILKMIWPLLMLLEPAHPQFLPQPTPSGAQILDLDRRAPRQPVLQLQLLSSYPALKT
jgi:hypothetical protein